MIVGGYSLHLYCDTDGCKNQNARPTQDSTGAAAPGEFNGDTKNECVKAARRRGWSLSFLTGRATCPDCPKPARR